MQHLQRHLFKYLLEYCNVSKLRYKLFAMKHHQIDFIRQLSHMQLELLASTWSLRVTYIALPVNCKLDALPWKNATFPTVLNLLKQIESSIAALYPYSTIV